MKDQQSVNTTELHAYLDKQLDENQRKQIEADLNYDEQARENLQAYQNLNHALHKLYDPVLEEHIPKRLLSIPSHRASYPAMAASVFFFVFGALLGWQAQLNLVDIHKFIPSKIDLNLVQPAAFAHSVYAVEVAHPVEVSADQHQHLNKWLSKRLKTTLTAPDLTQSGYRLMGGRLLPSTEARMAAQYMYENNGGNRVTLYVRHGDWNRDSQAISYSEEKGYSTFYWTDDDMGYALTSELDKNLHQNLAEEVYKQIRINTVKI